MIILHHSGKGTNIHDSTAESWGYNRIIRRTGKVLIGRGGGHTFNHNQHFGVCFLGNYEELQPTQAQIDSLVKIMRDRNDFNLKGHRDFANNPPGRNRTACPGKNLYRRIPNIIKQAKRKERKVELYRVKGKPTVYLKDGKYYPIRSATAFNKWFGKDAWDYIKEVNRLNGKVADFRITEPADVADRLNELEKQAKASAEVSEKLIADIDDLGKVISKQEKTIDDMAKEIDSLKKALRTSGGEKSLRKKIIERIAQFFKDLVEKYKKLK